MNKIILTADGSNTLYNETIGEHYHSTHGALQESLHVFIDAGLKAAAAKFGDQELSVLEVGFGTGLNFILTLDYAVKEKLRVNYISLEVFPLTKEEFQSTGYDKYVAPEIWQALAASYPECINRELELLPNQSLKVVHTSLQEFKPLERYNLLYYDAFSVRHQPEMWTEEVIGHAASLLIPGGIFVTYAITGHLKRALKSFGFSIEKLPGAPGKREMLRATKL
ncbi:tRNA (5-methylaminomethyl-2-thiouridine)(34)-methyltransferase MnmD [Pedobacter duraquae]|uniref:tRNA U34 5-methylaminomethyl-2-thiouridine-forming methyltransferase MnmC n=1 Tax=Pedobacter duraquae TaxID=425511 RepID=A0A4R6IR53_9SPHI|nr:tRNA (5-methylaminomethyl-2-thiouridine)(34)-methyltransferase MnmD [Pedobacter duraquae]TDO24890.1 tRNA U34 5-methylaminomethyl-2-thiouridine-forming methyltransferase MnmC [Pedobacter duraquae]